MKPVATLSDVLDIEANESFDPPASGYEAIRACAWRPSDAPALLSSWQLRIFSAVCASASARRICRA